MFSRTSTFDKLLDKATSNLLLEPDWPSMLQICDLIRQNDVQPKYALAAIKKKLFNPNPHCSMYALQVLESVVKNCGASVHEELTTKTNCEMLHELAKTTQHENVKNKVLELIQAWSFAFRKSTKYRALKDIMNIMKTEGFKFPQIKETDAMFSADNAPEWTDGDVCHRCRVAFSFMQRKHHCRACGQVFCGICSQKTTTLPKFGIEKEVRVCEACYEQANKPATATTSAAEPKAADSELPAEYLASSLAQQNQAPPRKTEEELREEEELQLALAISKSEAEEKEKEKIRVTNAILSNAEQRSPLNTANTPRSVSPPQEDSTMDPELARYLNRSYWETRGKDEPERPASPSAPSPMSNTSSVKQQVNGFTDPEMDEFVQTLKSQVEIFVNRMKSNSSRGRSIANDSSVQTLFMNITAMHSRLLKYIQQQDDARLYYEGLQDKLVQIKDARAALDALREEHCEKLRRQAEEAERQRQLQMAQKLEIMRKKKQEYLQYQRQLALQRIQEQEREMQMRQEQQKQQYLMGSQYAYMGSPVHNASQYGTMGMNPMYYHQYNPQMGVPMQGPSSMPMNMPVMHQNQGNQNQPMPMVMPPPQIPTTQTSNAHQMHQLPQPGVPLQNPPPGLSMPMVTHQMPPGVPPQMPPHVMSPPNIGMAQNGNMVMQTPNHVLPSQHMVNNMPVNNIPTNNLPVSNMPVNNLPGNSLPVNNLPVNNLPVTNLPVNNLPVTNLPVNNMQYGNEAYGAPMNMHNQPQKNDSVAELISFD